MYRDCSGNRNEVVVADTVPLCPPRRRWDTQTVFVWGLTTVFLTTLGFSASRAAQPPVKKRVKTATTNGADSTAIAAAAGLTLEECNQFEERFKSELWPIMNRSCIGCHGQKNPSQFLLLQDHKAAFLKMLSEDHFDPDNHASTMERVTTTDKAIKMPPSDMTPLTPAEIALFTRFAEDVQKKRQVSNIRPDEQFPGHLLASYVGNRQPEGLDNTFLSYQQLRGKTKAIFGDDWKRGGRDLFVENAYLFGGADYIKRFDESTRATPEYLTGLDMLGRDMTSRAYLARTGPFAGFPDTLPAPVSNSKSASTPVLLAIRRLYQRMLFRDPSLDEQKEALAFLQNVYKAQGQLAQTAPQDLRFALTVRDDAGMTTARDVSIHVSADSHALYSEFMDQSKDAVNLSDKTAARTATVTLQKPLTFVAGDTGQKLVLTNDATHGNVSVSSVTLRGPLPERTEKTIPVNDTSVRAEGAWHIHDEEGFTSYEDNNENKGRSQVTFPVTVEKSGSYEVAFTWRRFPEAPKPNATGKVRRRRGAPTNGAENVLVEVVSSDTQSHLAIPTAPPVPPKGEVTFTIDETVDSVPYWDLNTSFQFKAPSDGVEISNENTHKRVVADAVRLTPADVAESNRPSALPPAFGIAAETGKNSVLVLNSAGAVGKENWSKFQVGGFSPYNTVGPDIFQDTDDKGAKKADLSLLYKPILATKEGFQASRFYTVGVIFPGQVDNETDVPVVVHAQASSPIIQIVHPYHAHVGAAIKIDASPSFNLQRTSLHYKWEQIGGPRVALKDYTTPVLTFKAPAITAQQAAWEGLCRALLQHPDFLFTRPRSLMTITDPKQRRRLQLVKIAQDTIARTPTADEIAQVDNGVPLEKLVDKYLASPEFQDFYFRRVRLYVESHGTPEQDEPARLWTYIATHDRPFKEVLTADYTVDGKGQRQTRPAFHGKTGILTMKGFIEGKPGLPHFNYPAQVCEKFLGYVFEVPDEVLKVRNGLTASATTDPKSVCYSCHKVLTPLAYQRRYWDDSGVFRMHDETGMMLNASDESVVASYPFKGAGLEAFATQAQNKERFIRAMLQTHFIWYFGRDLRYDTDERGLYHRLWNNMAKDNYAIRPLIKSLVLAPEYLNATVATNEPTPEQKRAGRIAQLKRFHGRLLGMAH